MIVCKDCGYKSTDMRDFSTHIVHPPRGLKIDPALSKDEKDYILLQNRFIIFSCGRCGKIYTTKPGEYTRITLETYEA